MNRRDALRQLGALVLLAGSAGLAPAREDRFYVLEPPVPTDTEGKIEVLEFFYYGCPHCRDFDPLLREWLKKLPADVAFTRVPVSWGARDLRHQNEARLYYAILATRQLDTLHEKAFVAIQDERLNPGNEDAVREWAEKQRVDVKTFMGAYHSFGVQTQVRRAGQLTRAYKIESVPTVAVGGRFVTLASLTGGHRGTLEETDRRIERVRRG